MMTIALHRALFVDQEAGAIACTEHQEPLARPDIDACSDNYVVTLQLDTASLEWFQALRTAHFPPLQNRVPAHWSLLHRVSRDQVNRPKEGWKGMRGWHRSRCFTGLKSMGRGTARCGVAAFSMS